MSGVFIDVKANADRATRELQDVNKSLGNIESSALSAGKSIGRVVRSIAAIATVGLGGNALFRVSNNFSNLENKIASVTGRTNELILAQKELYKIARDTRSSIQSSVETFGAFGRSLKGTGKPMSEILVATKAIQQSIAIYGTDAESANAAIIQLGQGLAAGALRGQELMSVMEQLPRVAEAIADGMGVAKSSLKSLAEQGKLTDREVFGALVRESAAISKEFEALAPTIGQAGGYLKDSMSIYTSELDKGFNLTAAITRGTFRFADGISDAADGAFEMGNRFMFALQTAQQMIEVISKPLGASLKTMGEYFLRIIPDISFTDTLSEDLNSIIRDIDRSFLGGAITSFKQIRLVDFINIESDVELALRQIRRLSPRNWAAAGFDVETIKEIFSVRNLKLYGDAFGDLAVALAGNTNTIGTVLRRTFINVDNSFKSALRYIGLTDNALISIKTGFLETFFVSLAQIGKGITGLSVPFYKASRLIFDMWAPSLFNVFTFLGDVLRSLPKVIMAVIEAMAASAVKAVKMLATIMADWVPVTSLSKLFKDIALEFLKFTKVAKYTKVIESAFDSMVGNIFSKTKSGLGRVQSFISSFGDSIKGTFLDIYDKVVGNSYWPDMVDGVIAYAVKLKNVAGSIFVGFVSVVKENMGELDSLLSKMSSFGSGAWTTGVSAMAESGGFLGIVNSFSEGISSVVGDLGGLSRVLAAIAAAIATPIIILRGLSSTFRDLTDSIYAVVKNGLPLVLEKVISFAEKIKDAFFDIYDKVVGNSYWPDTIDGVVEYSRNLWERVSVGLLKFRSKVLKLFSEVYAGVGERLQARSVSVPEILVPSVAGVGGKLNSLYDGLRNFATKVADIFQGLGPKIQSALNAALSFAAAAITVGLLRGDVAGQFRARIIAVAASIAFSLSNNLSEKLFGGSFASVLGEAVGKFIGGTLAALFDALPEILNAASSFFSSLTQGLAKELPIIGGLLTGILNIAGKFSSALPGALGLIGTYFLGTKLIPALLSDDSWKKTIGKILAAGKAMITGSGGGILSRYLFGPLGLTRSLSGIGLALTMFGAIDGIFMDSVLLEYATKGGLLYLFLAGEGGLTNVKQLVAKYLGRPLISAVESVLSTSGLGRKFSDVLFGSVGTFGQRAVDNFGPILTGFTTSITTTLSSYVGTGLTWVQGVLLGPNPRRTMAKIELLVRGGMDRISTALRDFSRSPIFASIGRAFSGIFGGRNGAGGSSGVLGALTSLLSNITASLTRFARSITFRAGPDGFLGALFLRGPAAIKNKIVDFLALMRGKFAAFSAYVNRLGGPMGSLGRLLIGRAGKAALIAAIVAGSLFAGKAFASEKDEGDVPDIKPDKSVLDSLVDDWASLKISNPFQAMAYQIAAVTLPSIVAAFYIFRARIGALLLATFSGSIIQDWARRARTAATRTQRAFGSALGGTAGALAGYFGGGAEGAIIGGTIGATIGSSIITGIITKLATVPWIMTIGAMLSGALLAAVPIMLAAVAALSVTAVGLAVAGAAGVWLFGTGDDFNEKLDKAIARTREFFNLEAKSPSVDARTGLKTEVASRAKNLGIEQDFNLSRLNRSNLPERTLEKLNERLEEYSKLILEASENQMSGKEDETLMKRIQTSNRGLERQVSKAVSASVYSTEEFRNTIEDLSKQEGKTSIFTASQQSFDQIGLDAVYAINMWLADAFNSADIRERLESQKDKEFNAGYTAPEQVENIKMLTDLSKEYDAGEKPNAVLNAQIDNIRAKYIELFRELREEQDKGFFSARVVDNDSPLMKNLEHAAETAGMLMRQGIEEGLRLVDTRLLNNQLQNLFTSLKDFGVEAQETQFLSGIDLQELKTFLNFMENIKLTLETDAPNVDIQNNLKADMKRMVKNAQNVIDDSIDSNPNLSISMVASMRVSSVDLGLSPEIISSMSDGLGTRVNDTITELRNTDDRVANGLLSAASATILKSIKKYRTLTGVAKEGKIDALKEVAEMANVDFDQIYRNDGLQAVRDATIEGLTLQGEGVRAAASENEKNYSLFEKDFLAFTDRLNRAVLTAPNLMSALGDGMSKGFEEASFRGIDSSGLQTLKDAGLAIQIADDGIKNLGSNFSALDLKKLLTDKFIAASAAIKVTTAVMAKLPQGVIAALNSAGFSTYKAMNRLSKEATDTFVGIESELQVVEAELKGLTVGTEKYYTAMKRLAILEASRDRLSALAGNSLADQNNVVGSVLQGGFSDREFAMVDSKLRSLLFRFSSAAKEAFDNFAANAQDSAQKSLNLFGVISAIDSQAEILKLGKDLKISLAQSAYEGLGEGFARAQNAIGEITIAQFAKVSKASRDKYKADSKAIEQLRKVAEAGLTNEQQDILLTYDKTNAEEVVAAIAASAKLSLKELLTQITPSSEFQDMKTSVDLNTDALGFVRDALYKFAGVEVPEALKPVTKETGAAPKSLETGDRDTSSVFRKLDVAEDNLTSGITKKAFGGIEGSLRNLISASDDAGKSLDISTLRLASDSDRKKLKGLIGELNALDTSGMNPRAIEQARLGFEREVDSILKGVTRLADGMRAAGQAMSEGIRGSIKTGLTALMAGENKSFTSFFESLANTFTLGVIEAFTQGIADQLISGVTDGFLKKINEGQYGLGSQVASGIGGLFGGEEESGSTAAGYTGDAFKSWASGGEEGTEAAAGFFSNVKGQFGKLTGSVNESFFAPLMESFVIVGNGIINMLSGLMGGGGGGGDLFGTILGIGASVAGAWGGGAAASSAAGASQAGYTGAAFGAWLKKADGGLITGPGTGTSDSIPTMLSNREFVVNAKDTQKNLGLLTALNSGQSISKFAKGGQVGRVSKPTYISNDKMSPKSSSQQIFNVNITGDISRQTKAEIYKMLPSIAQGVNKQNREVGSRR